MPRPPQRHAWAAGIAATAILVAGCTAAAPTGSDPTVRASATAPAPSESADPAPAPSSVGPAGESIITVGMAEPYAPSSAGTATDDYRCFIVDPALEDDVFITGVRFAPGNPDIVHHAILYRVAPDQVAGALKRDEEEPGQGWTCFGGPDLPASQQGGGDIGGLGSAAWLAAWAPGGRVARMPEGTGVHLPAGSVAVLQVHYNLLAGDGPDQTAVELMTEPGDADLARLETLLLPAPVELPCLPEESGPLCDREAAVRDTIGRFGGESLRTIWGLQLICGGELTEPKAGPTQSCDHRARTDLEIYSAAGHMHLLGRTITIEANPGTDRARVLLEVPTWDFDNQGATRLDEPLTVSAGDVLRVTCTHDARLRSMLPALKDIEPRYVTWGEGTTDEMCLGILSVVRR